MSRIIQPRKLTTAQVIKSNLLARHKSLFENCAIVEPTKALSSVFDEPIKTSTHATP